MGLLRLSLCLLFLLVFFIFTVAAQALESLQLKPGQYIYTVPSDFQPPDITPQDLHYMQAQARQLHYPFFVVLIQAFEGQSDQDVAKLIDDYAARWATDYPDIYDPMHNNLFVLSYQPRKFRFLAGADFRQRLGFAGQKVHQPYLDLFLSEVKGKNKRPAKGISKLMSGVDQYLWKKKDWKKDVPQGVHLDPVLSQGTSEFPGISSPIYRDSRFLFLVGGLFLCFFPVFLFQRDRYLSKKKQTTAETLSSVLSPFTAFSGAVGLAAFCYLCFKVFPEIPMVALLVTSVFLLLACGLFFWVRKENKRQLREHKILRQYREVKISYNKLRSVYQELIVFLKPYTKHKFVSRALEQKIAAFKVEHKRLSQKLAQDILDMDLEARSSGETHFLKPSHATEVEQILAQYQYCTLDFTPALPKTTLMQVCIKDDDFEKIKVLIQQSSSYAALLPLDFSERFKSDSLAMVQIERFKPLFDVVLTQQDIELSLQNIYHFQIEEPEAFAELLKERQRLHPHQYAKMNEKLTPKNAAFILLRDVLWVCLKHVQKIKQGAFKYDLQEPTYLIERDALIQQSLDLIQGFYRLLKTGAEWPQCSLHLQEIETTITDLKSFQSYLARLLSYELSMYEEFFERISTEQNNTTTILQRLQDCSQEHLGLEKWLEAAKTTQIKLKELHTEGVVLQQNFEKHLKHFRSFLALERQLILIENKREETVTLLESLPQKREQLLKIRNEIQQLLINWRVNLRTLGLQHPELRDLDFEQAQHDDELLRIHQQDLAVFKAVIAKARPQWKTYKANKESNERRLREKRENYQRSSDGYASSSSGSSWSSASSSSSSSGSAWSSSSSSSGSSWDYDSSSSGSDWDSDSSSSGGSW